ncbi:vomeronasal type-2 receptor 26-like [Dendropsophus ebraccatus]|uniref:vomeronasal type-2 receptor 26-like n=1 Tax=Dendropsophus ebraccatus TaxID=150705 RepID=UPI0038316DBB
MVGGVVTVNNLADFHMNGISPGSMMCLLPIFYYYQHLLAFFYAVDEINNDLSILPNLTLGYHIYDSCADPRKAIKSILQILSGPGHIVPNYSCTRKKKKVVGFIGDHFSSTTLPIAQLLGIYPYSQISYGATDTMLSERRLFPSFFRTVPDDHTTYSVISHFLSYFRWTWVGIIASDDEAGERETRLLTNLLTSRGICVAYVIKCITQFHNFLEEMMCSNKSREGKSFNRKRDKELCYYIYNIISWNYRNVTLNTVGGYNLSSVNGLGFWVGQQRIIWKNNPKEVPRSQCSASCLPGQRKVTTSSIYLCCYDCTQCPEGEISNVSDSENCRKCPEDAWSNENRTLCAMKEMEYLSYTEDIISIAFSSLATFFWILTLLILIIIVSQRDTAIVRANNKNLSFVLLVSIMLSFLSVFLFLGHPVDTTCRLRQISTGILLSISISSLLAKTIMVYMAFRATKPGSVWSRWSGVTLPNCVLLICSSVQGVICMSWVTLSPPFQELDTHSYKEKMVVQCNEGSDLCFYSVLGYMGILAAVSFITAFLARTLPDSFNEAKYITFSMLVFCSVWIAMIPAYLSTKGKYMVAVEIFAILTSNAGLLGCIFFPKCYIILLKPELNTRQHILGSKNSMLHH